MAFATIPELVAELRAGRMVVILDDEDRENEGDLIMAAAAVRHQDINFMARYARGLICLSLTRQRCEQLRLPPMVNDNTSPHHTNFTVSIEAASGVTTGISAHDRAHTIRTAVRTDARAEDLTQPGHVFPLQSQPGGVLTRAGHTEAASDLASLAGFEPAGVLVEILNEDGSMARRPQLEEFAKEHKLKIGSIADLIRYRLGTEKTVNRVHEENVQTEFGEFRLVAYRDTLSPNLHFALVRGSVDDGSPVLTRVHVRNALSDVLHMTREDLGMTIVEALRAIDRQKRGALIVLSQAQDADSLVSELKRRKPASESGIHDWRHNGTGAQILADLGVRQLRIIGTPRRFVGLQAFGLTVVGYETQPAAEPKPR
jgi:3,4-dihydroxy 2-butanone 4-phosphate synthase / GTP cyclohydrolase II